jgi:GDP-L-fucose synthase
MKRVLLTGGSGFIGRNIKDYLSEKYILFAPTRKELNLLSETDVRDYISQNNIEIVIHAANPNPVKNSLDKAESMVEDSIRVFLNLYQAQDILHADGIFPVWYLAVHREAVLREDHQF